MYILTYEDLNIFKSEYPYNKIMYICYEDREFVFRSLGRKEYNEIISIVSDEKDLEDVLCQTALLYPKDYEISTGLAGLPPYVSKILLEISNFTNLDDVLYIYEDAKAKMNGFSNQCTALIKAAMPEYTLEEIKEWTWQELMEKTAMAEKIMILKGHEDLQLVNKSEEAKEEAEKQLALEDDENFIMELRQQGIDPMFYFMNLDHYNRKEIIDYPLIGGRHWNNEGVLNEIRKQIKRKQIRR